MKKFLGFSTGVSDYQAVFVAAAIGLG